MSATTHWPGCWKTGEKKHAGCEEAQEGCGNHSHGHPLHLCKPKMEPDRCAKCKDTNGRVTVRHPKGYAVAIWKDCDHAPAQPPDRCADMVEKVMQTRREHIEKMTCAWLTEHPGLSPSDAEIVEEHGKDAIRIYVQRRAPAQPDRLPASERMSEEECPICGYEPGNCHPGMRDHEQIDQLRADLAREKERADADVARMKDIWRTASAERDALAERVKADTPPLMTAMADRAAAALEEK